VKNIFIILAILVTPPALYAENFDIRVSSINTARTGKNEYRITFSVITPGLAIDLAEGIPCLVPAEAFRVTGNTRETGLRERDILFASTDIDLNGDGDLDDIFTITKSGRALSIIGHGKCPVISTAMFRGYRTFQYLDSTGSPLFCKIGKKGTPFFVNEYQPRSHRISLAFGTPEGPLSMIELPNPHVRVSIIAATDNIRSVPAYTLAGEKTRNTFSNEKFLDDQAGSWAGIIWCAKPLQSGQSAFTFTLQGISPPFIISIVPCLSIEKGTLLRGREKRKGILK